MFILKSVFRCEPVDQLPYYYLMGEKDAYFIIYAHIFS